MICDALLVKKLKVRIKADNVDTYFEFRKFEGLDSQFKEFPDKFFKVNQKYQITYGPGELLNESQFETHIEFKYNKYFKNSRVH